MPRPSKAAGSVAFVTGANRGIGLGFVQELVARAARKIYVGVRSPGDVTDQFKELPVEVVPLDVTDLALVRAAASGCPDVNHGLPDGLSGPARPLARRPRCVSVPPAARRFRAGNAWSGGSGSQEHFGGGCIRAICSGKGVPSAVRLSRFQPDSDVSQQAK